MEGQSQRRSAPRGLSAEAAEADPGDMDVAEALEAGAESAAGASSWPKGWASWSRYRKKKWRAVQSKKQRK